MHMCMTEPDDRPRAHLHLQSLPDIQRTRSVSTYITQIIFMYVYVMKSIIILYSSPGLDIKHICLLQNQTQSL